MVIMCIERLEPSAIHLHVSSQPLAAKVEGMLNRLRAPHTLGAARAF
jgi:hypothetical protein